MEARLRFCFNTMAVDMNKVSELVDEYDEDEDSTKELRAMYKELTKQTPVPDGILNIIRAHINSAFVEHLGTDTPAGNEFGDPTSGKWAVGMANYTDHLVSTVTKTVDDLVSSGELSKMEISEDARLAVQNCAAKMKIVLTAGADFQRAMSYLPFMCRSAYSFMSTRLSTISDALTEVSMMFSLFYHFCANT